MSIVPDYEQTIKFLDIFRPNGPHLLTAIPVEGGRLVTKRFESTDGVVKWCETMNDAHGLYYHVGVPREGVDRRMNKLAVGAIDHFWVDVDPKGDNLGEARHAIVAALMATPSPEGVPQRPSIIVDSGGGFQGLWRLSEPIILCDEKDIIEVERITRHLVKAYNGDTQAWNVDRLLRLPGTINNPNAIKLKKGRVSSISIFKAIPGGMVDHYGFAKSAPAAQDKRGDELSIKVKGRNITYTAKSLPAGLNEKWVDIIVKGEESWHFGDTGYASRSEMVLGATRFMLEQGMEHQIIYDILLSPELAISNHVYAQQDTHRYSKRQISQALKGMSNKKIPAKPASSENVEDMQFKYIETRDGKGTPKIDSKWLNNAIVAAHKLGYKCEYNELSDVATINGKKFEDHAVTEFRIEVENKFKVTFSDRLATDAIKFLCMHNIINPVLDYLNGLPEWDEVKRLDTWLMDYCGAENTKFNKAVSRIILVAAVRRMKQPGCKFDEMLILEGEQGDGKSELLRKGLMPNEEWFSDSVVMDQKIQDFIESTSGHWILECAELVSMSRAKVESLKALLSRSTDKARLAYARSRTDRPRRFIIFGSTNQEKYLVDDTGNRRFWPVPTKGNLAANITMLAANRDQIWAEACVANKAKESIRLDPSLYDDARKIQDLRQVVNPLLEPLIAALGSMDGVIRSWDLLEYLNINVKDHSRYFRKLGTAMRGMGFQNKQIFRDGRNTNFWQRGDSSENIVLHYDDGTNNY